MILTLLMSVLPVGQMTEVTWRAPEMLIEGEPFVVSVEIKVSSDERTPYSAWLLTPAAFTFNSRPLGKKDGTTVIKLERGARLSLSYDLGPAIIESESFDGHDFLLGFVPDRLGKPIEVTYLPDAEKGIDFMTLPVEQLSEYEVVLMTGRGAIRLELWPAVAPNHVRNFLDLAYTGFYDGATFHRVIPTFMIQGGRPKEGREAPRTVDMEFSGKKHVPGVLSAARLGGEVNSASSEFFIVHGPSPQLNGNYSAFGEVLTGMDVVDRIALSGDARYRPNDPRSETPATPQVIEKAIVVKAIRRNPNSQNR